MIVPILIALGKPTYHHPITAWVSPYAVAASLARLRSGVGMASTLTHLSLQFWVPTAEGGVARAAFPETTDANVATLRNWAHAHRIRALLCVFNGEKKWDWPLARAAFNHPVQLVQGLVAEMDRQHLDGIDVDFEGIGEFDADCPAFVGFVRRLSSILHRRGKALTVDCFPAQWNAPSANWWPDLFPLVDQLVSMEYENGGRKSAGPLSYAGQKRAAGRNVAKLQIGLPADKDAWAGDAALDQLRWIERDGTMGIGIWDAQLSAAGWRSAEVWKTLAKIRG